MVKNYWGCSPFEALPPGHRPSFELGKQFIGRISRLSKLERDLDTARRRLLNALNARLLDTPSPRPDQFNIQRKDLDVVIDRYLADNWGRPAHMQSKKQDSPLPSSPGIASDDSLFNEPYKTPDLFNPPVVVRAPVAPMTRLAPQATRLPPKKSLRSPPPQLSRNKDDDKIKDNTLSRGIKKVSANIDNPPKDTKAKTVDDSFGGALSTGSQTSLNYDNFSTRLSKRHLSPVSNASSSPKVKRRRARSTTDELSTSISPNLYGTRSRSRTNNVELLSLDQPFPREDSQSLNQGDQNYKDVPVLPCDITNVGDSTVIRYPIAVPAGKGTYDCIENAEDLEELKQATISGRKAQKDHESSKFVQEATPAEEVVAAPREPSDEVRVLLDEMREVFEMKLFRVVVQSRRTPLRPSFDKSEHDFLDQLHYNFLAGFRQSQASFEDGLAQLGVLENKDKSKNEAEGIKAIFVALKSCLEAQTEAPRKTPRSIRGPDNFRESLSAAGAIVLDLDDFSDGDQIAENVEDFESFMWETNVLGVSPREASGPSQSELAEAHNPQSPQPDSAAEILGAYIDAPVLIGLTTIQSLPKNNLQRIREIFETDPETQNDRQKFKTALKLAHEENEKQSPMKPKAPENPTRHSSSAGSPTEGLQSSNRMRI